MVSALVMKVKYGDSLRRVKLYVDENGFVVVDMDSLLIGIFNLFELSHDDDITLTYVDEDGDSVQLVDEEDLSDAIGQGLNPLRITVQVHNFNTRTGFKHKSRSARLHPSAKRCLKSTPKLVQDKVGGFSRELTAESPSYDSALSYFAKDVPQLEISHTPPVPQMWNGSSFSSSGSQNQSSDIEYNVSKGLDTCKYLDSGKNFDEITAQIPIKSDVEYDSGIMKDTPTFLFQNPSFSDQSQIHCKKNHPHGYSPRDTSIPLCGDCNAFRGELRNAEGTDGSDWSTFCNAFRGELKNEEDATYNDFTFSNMLGDELEYAEDRATNDFYTSCNALRVKQENAQGTTGNEWTGSWNAFRSELENAEGTAGNNWITFCNSFRGEWNDWSDCRNAFGEKLEKEDGGIRNFFSSDSGLNRELEHQHFIPASVQFGTNRATIMPSQDYHPSQTFNLNYYSRGREAETICKCIECNNLGRSSTICPQFMSGRTLHADLCIPCSMNKRHDTEHVGMNHATLNQLPQSTQLPNHSQAWHQIPNSQNVSEHCRMKKPARGLDSILVEDKTIPNGNFMKPETPFTKIWRICNNGSIVWPEGTELVWIGGHELTDKVSIQIDCCRGDVYLNDEIDVAVDVIAPKQPGRYVSYWRMALSSGFEFGQVVWIEIQVVPLNISTWDLAAGGCREPYNKMGDVSVESSTVKSAEAMVNVFPEGRRIVEKPMNEEEFSSSTEEDLLISSELDRSNLGVKHNNMRNINENDAKLSDGKWVSSKQQQQPAYSSRK